MKITPFCSYFVVIIKDNVLDYPQLSKKTLKTFVERKTYSSVFKGLSDKLIPLSNFVDQVVFVHGRTYSEYGIRKQQSFKRKVKLVSNFALVYFKGDSMY